MWNRLVAWHRGWEERHLRLLENPARAADLPHGWERRYHEHAGALSDIERLQLLAFSRKYRGWRSYAWIGGGMVLCSLLAWLAHPLMPHKSLFKMIVAANVIGLAMLTTFVVAWFNYRKFASNPLRAGLSFVMLGSVGMLIGTAIGSLQKGRPLLEQFVAQPPSVYLLVLGIAVSFLFAITSISLWRNKEYEALTARMQLDAERDRSARLQSESELRLLRAQIEPHFLFNTLGAVQQLAGQGAPRAAELTGNLIAFLRSSLDGMRRDNTSLRQEFQLVASYLQVMQVRMGPRLQYRLALPDELAQFEVPSMMLLTLAENAIKHGVEPALRGGEIVVSAKQEGAMLRLQVADSGVGLAEQPGNGHGLANIRQRLQLAYGSSARLDLAESDGGGVLADILLPLERKSA